MAAAAQLRHVECVGVGKREQPAQHVGVEPDGASRRIGIRAAAGGLAGCGVDDVLAGRGGIGDARDMRRRELDVGMVEDAVCHLGRVAAARATASKGAAARKSAAARVCAGGSCSHHSSLPPGYGTAPAPKAGPPSNAAIRITASASGGVSRTATPFAMIGWMARSQFPAAISRPRSRVR